MNSSNRQKYPKVWAMKPYDPTDINTSTVYIL